MRMIHVTYPGEWVCMCARGGARGWACCLNSTHTCTHIYTYTQVAYVRRGGKGGGHVASPESGWKMPHCAMYECIVSHICMSQEAPELVHQGTAIILPGKKRGITVTSKKYISAYTWINRRAFGPMHQGTAEIPYKTKWCHHLLLPAKKKSKGLWAHIRICKWAPRRMC